MNKAKLLLLCSLATSFTLVKCTQSSNNQSEKNSSEKSNLSEDLRVAYNGYNSLEEYGGHLVMIAGCHDCHTPKKMGLHGPELDMDLALSGHPAQMPPPDVNRAEMEAKGIASTTTLTSWVGPWGISYAANLTSDDTGIGNWNEENFFRALREGTYKGLEHSRPLLPPMPVEATRFMSDEELRAIFAYLKSTKPIKNVVPAPEPPLSALK